MKKLFERLSSWVTNITGSSGAFIVALLVVICWSLLGPVFSFSDTWQLVINTGTTIITFLMVFVIQHSANKDTKAIHLKLNELIASSSFASNRLIDIEDLTAEEIEVLKKYYVKLSKLAENEKDIHASHSLDEANIKHGEKSARLRRRPE